MCFLTAPLTPTPVDWCSRNNWFQNVIHITILNDFCFTSIQIFVNFGVHIIHKYNHFLRSKAIYWNTVKKKPHPFDSQLIICHTKRYISLNNFLWHSIELHYASLVLAISERLKLKEWRGKSPDPTQNKGRHEIKCADQYLIRCTECIFVLGEINCCYQFQLHPKTLDPRLVDGSDNERFDR